LLSVALWQCFFRPRRREGLPAPAFGVDFGPLRTACLRCLERSRVFRVAEQQLCNNQALPSQMIEVRLAPFVRLPESFPKPPCIQRDVAIKPAREQESIDRGTAARHFCGTSLLSGLVGWRITAVR